MGARHRRCDHGRCGDRAATHLRAPSARTLVRLCGDAQRSRSNDRTRAAGGLSSDRRNWLGLRGIEAIASVLDAIALLIAMFTLGQLSIGPSLGAAAAVLTLVAHGASADWFL